MEALERWAKEMREREDTERAEKALAVKEHPHPPPAPQPAPAAP